MAEYSMEELCKEGFWKIVDGRWVQAEPGDFPTWDETRQSWSGYTRYEGGPPEDGWTLFQSIDDNSPMRWIFEHGADRTWNVLMTHPQDMMDLVYKAKIGSLYYLLTSDWSLANLVDGVLNELPKAAHRRQLEEQRRRKMHFQRQQQKETK